MSTSQTRNTSRQRKLEIARWAHALSELVLTQKAGANWTDRIDRVLDASSLLSTLDRSSRSLSGWQIGGPWPRPWSTELASCSQSSFFVGRDSLAMHSRWHSIVSSKTRRHSDASPNWNRRLEAAMKQCLRDRASLFIGRALPFGGHIEHVASQFGLPFARIRLFDGKQGIESAFGEVLDAILKMNAAIDEKSSFDLAFISMNTAIEGGGQEREFEKIRHDLDGLLVALPDVVHAIEVRAGGRIESLLRKRLDSPVYPEGGVRVSIDYPPVAESDYRQSVEQWMKVGAVGEMVRMNAAPSTTPQIERTSGAGVPATQQPIFFDSLWHRRLDSDSGGWLTHCTRGRSGPWPDESMSEYYDQLLLGNRSIGFTAQESLLRILKMQRLLATHYLKRSGLASVSFSAVPLRHLVERRTYQRHLGRWDWEPYGICVRAEAAVRLGVRQVVYVDDDQSVLASHSNDTDVVPPNPLSMAASGEMVSAVWQEEKEWRHPGDLRLCQIGWEDAFVFVPTVDEAVWISPFCRFPILVLDRLTKDRKVPNRAEHALQSL